MYKRGFWHCHDVDWSKLRSWHVGFAVHVFFFPVHHRLETVITRSFNMLQISDQVHQRHPWIVPACQTLCFLLQCVISSRAKINSLETSKCPPTEVLVIIQKVIIGGGLPAFQMEHVPAWLSSNRTYIQTRKRRKVNSNEHEVKSSIVLVFWWLPAGYLT